MKSPFRTFAAQVQSPDRNGKRAIVVKGLTCVAIGLLAANCSQGPQRVSQRGSEYFPEGSKYGKASPRVVAEGEAVPKGGGRYQVGNAYSVAGRTYIPRDMNRNYAATGLASWYGSAFHGRRTSNGEVYDKLAFTAAHPTMPLPSYARVTNLTNGRSMIVRVNDRGPFHGGRVMDVSERVAEALDFKRMGTARIKVEHMAPAGLAGSDDRKLLASLRLDGQPATLPGVPQQEVQVASAEPAFTSIPERGASVPVSRASVPVLQSRAAESDAQGEEQVADASDSNTAEATARPQLASSTVESRPLASPLRGGVPLPPERPFSIGGGEPAQLSSLGSQTQRVGASVPAVTEPTRIASAPADGYRAAKGFGYAPAAQKVSYFASASDVSSQFGKNDPFRSLDGNRFVPSAEKAVKANAGGISVAVGVFRSAANAERVAKLLGADVETLHSPGAVAYKVTAGPFESTEPASRAVAKARNAGAADARMITR